MRMHPVFSSDNASTVYVHILESSNITHIPHNHGFLTHFANQYEQASGVLIAPDEVLTAAHIFAGYDTNQPHHGFVGIGSSSSDFAETSEISNVHIANFSDVGQPQGSEMDFALLHLTTPIADVEPMQIGSGFSSGVANITGYPTSAGGSQEGMTEHFSQIPDTNVLTGHTLGAADGRGSSGGPVWDIVNGLPTVVAIASSGNSGHGYFTKLSSNDIAQINSWMTADHEH